MKLCRGLLAMGRGAVVMVQYDIYVLSLVIKTR